MIKFVKNDNNKNIILFVHGFTGDEDTWNHPDYGSFPLLLLKEHEIAEQYDIAHFSYFTKLLTTFTKASNVSKLIKNYFKMSYGKLQSNVSIEEIANLLRTETRFKLQSYDNIIVIAHSMGGLVVKSCITKDIQENVPSKIRLFVSLAVPHMGSDLATYGKLISNNIQIEELAPLNNFIHEINDVWLKTSLRPITKYFYGVHDDVVPKSSAAPISNEKSDIIPVEENHTSISKPEGDNSTTLVAVKQIILNYQTDDSGMSNIKLQHLEDDKAFDDELFVLKLIVADIHHSSVQSAKEVFLNAEYISKKFRSSSDQNRLADLYDRVRTIYKNSYTKYLHNGIANSGLLLADVHENILKEDRVFLSSLVPFISAIHKQGMLHQLANSEKSDIWWGKDTEIDSLYSHLIEKPSTFLRTQSLSNKGLTPNASSLKTRRFLSAKGV